MGKFKIDGNQTSHQIVGRIMSNHGMIHAKLITWNIMGHDITAHSHPRPMATKCCLSTNPVKTPATWAESAGDCWIHAATPVSHYIKFQYDYRLVGGWATPLKNMKVNWDDYSQYMGK